MNSLPNVRYNYFSVFLVAILTFLPLTTLGNILRLGVVGVLFLVKLRENSTITVEMAHVFVAMIFSLFIPCAAVIWSEGTFNTGVMMHEVQRFLFYILLIAVVYDYKVPFKYIYILCILVLLFNFTIQILQYNGVEEVTDFIRRYYLTSENDIHLMLASNKGADFRSGSIYMNPNVYMVIPSVILGVILQANMLKHSLINYIWAAIALGSLLLTGSRTTFFVALGILLFYLLLDREAGIIKWIVIGVFITYIFVNYGMLQEQFRVFAVSEGMDSSFEVKWEGLLYYLKNASPLYYITGSLSSAFHVQIDAEWGYIFAYFGVVGLYWYIKFINMLGRNKEKVKFLALSMKIVICLVAMTATIVLCMPVFSLFCLIGLVEIEV